MEEVMKDCQVLWNYLCLNTKPKKKECIIGLGSILTLIPKKCAKLYKENLGDYIIFSGNCGKGTEGVISITEAERFKNISMNENVPENKILTEPQATSTYENYKYIKKVLENNNLNPNSFLIVGKPYQERRALLIANIELADKEYEVASFNLTFNDYLEFVKSDEFMKVEDVINEMVGEIALIIKAPKYGLQSKDIIPEEVLKSYQKIVASGFNKYYYSDDMVKHLKDVLIEKGLD